MLKNYLKTGWRNLYKSKTFSLINVLGLALGLACSLLILLWVREERKMDAFHEHDAQLYSVFERQYHDGQIDAGHYTPGILADELKQTMAEVRYAAGMAWNEENTFYANNKILKQEGNYAGEDFFKMFSYPLLQGDPETVLKSPLDIAVSRKMAEDFFGSADAAYGQTIRYDNRKDMKITAVFENTPYNSSFQFDYILSWETFLENQSWARNWDNNGPHTFLMLQPGTDAAAFENKIRDFMDLHTENKNFVVRFGLQPFSEQYLHSNFENGEIVGGRVKYVRLFSIIAVFILLIACINFMNLTTARSVKRAKEIGIRKVAGAFRGALIRQFIGEALLIVVFAVLLALIVVAIALPSFNIVTQKHIALPVGESSFWISLVFLALVTGIISGSYPALYLSSFNPVRALKGTVKFNGSALWFRRSLVVFQFVLSIVLIVGTIVISKQVAYVQSASLGYNRENLIYVPLEGDLTGKYGLFKNRALTMPGIKYVSRVSYNPTSIENGTGGVEWEGKDPNSRLQFVQTAVGYDFMQTMGIQMAVGRDFSEDLASDSAGFIVNEAALMIIGYEDPVGMPLTFWDKPGTIIGVMKDFHFNSLHNDIKPLVLWFGENINWGWALIRTEPGRTTEALTSLEKLCKELNPQFSFTYRFSDEEYAKMYASEQVVATLSNVFAFLAVFISCLGLLGLAMFTTEQRTKEISIRKVLGASPLSLLHLLSKELLWLVGLALIIASPVAWITMDNWLHEYAYRIRVEWWIFGLAGLLATGIALFTVSFQTIKALLANPANSLKSD